jgi:hypothetical protein
MDTATQYAFNQVLGLQFESFKLLHDGVVYTWDNPILGWLCRKAVQYSLTPLAVLIFKIGVKRG